MLFAWNVNDAANYDCHRKTFGVLKCIRLSNITTRISMEKYFTNENLKKEYKTAILNQKDIRRPKRNTHTHIYAFA